MKILILVATALALSLGGLAGDKVSEGFDKPPTEALPRVLWHWVNGNVSKAGITADLEAMKNAGVGGALIFNVGMGNKIKPGPVSFNTPACDELFKFAASEANRLGLELTLCNCSSMCDCGGPWVAPSNSMFHLTWSETRIPGGKPFKGVIPRTFDRKPESYFNGFYRDIAVIAFPRPKAESEGCKKFNVRDDGANRIVTAADGSEFTLRGATVTLKHKASGWYLRMKGNVDVSDDGKTWRKEAEFDVLIRNGGAKQYTHDHVFVAFSKPVRGRFVRVNPTRGGYVADFNMFVPETKLGLRNIHEKFLYLRDYGAGAESRYPTDLKASPDEVIPLSSIVDVTDKMKPDGSFEWNVPAGGEWVILRIGYRSNGRHVLAASPTARGREVDRLDANAVERHFDGYVGKFAGLPGIAAIANDSCENGSQNWTHGLERDFESRMGYSIIPYLAAISGRVVESPTKTDLVLGDFRRLITDLFCERYVGTLKRKAHARGLYVAMEPAGNSPANVMDFACSLDHPMPEFWSGPDSGISYPFKGRTHFLDAKLMASAVNLNGGRFVDSEAFTAMPNNAGRWLKDPFSHKAIGDLFFTLGVNRCFIHRYAHQPWLDKVPGMTMGPWGTFFERTQTWWPFVSSWTRYLARCQFLLQSGRGANDLLLFLGDEIPRNSNPEKEPEGMSWDVCGGKQLQRLSAKDGLIMPNEYRALVLPRERYISPESMKKIEELKSAGVKVVYSDEDAGVAPDVKCADKDVRWIRRRLDDGRDAYFVASSKLALNEVICSFRQKGRYPQLWDAETGAKMRPLRWSAAGERTEVTLRFKPAGSVFVVFADSEDTGLPVEQGEFRGEYCEVAGEWKLSFPVDWYSGGTNTKETTIGKLASWTSLADDDMKYFSGIATYRKTLEIPKDAKRVVLDLGDVKNVAEVTVDGKTYPVLWRPPYRVELKGPFAEKSELVVRVANLWPNRLIGDERDPAHRKAYTVWKHWSKGDKLVASGILGPVRLICSRPSKSAELVSKLTPEERISQLMMDSPAVPRLGIPKYHWWNEALHGVARAGLATVFPQSMAMAATFDVELERRMADAISTEARAKHNLFRKNGERGIYNGLTFWSPNVNMFRDPRWGRGQETFGEDPFLAGEMGVAFVKGMQGDDPKYLKTAACAKHFAVHSGPEALRHGFDARISMRDMSEYYLPAFKALVVDGKVESVMGAYSAINGVPCCANKWLLTDLLRGEWGFNGHVVSDVGAVSDVFKGHHYTKDQVDACKATIAAGLDLCSEGTYGCLRGALKDGRIKGDDLVVPLEQLYRTRERLGQFDPPGSTPWDGLGAESVATDAHRAIALEAAEKSMVLVHNNGALPLDPSKCRCIGVVGPRANDEVALLGNYNGYSSSPVTCLPGIALEAGPGVRVDQVALNNLDVVVACIGLTTKDEGEEGEGGDRKSYELPGDQIKLLKKYRGRNRKVIAVVFGCSPLDLKPLEGLCDAVIVAWYPGEQGGRALGRLLFGKTNFSGRLPITYPTSYADLPEFKSYALDGRTYMYGEKTSYPFGYGLSYTKFAYSDLKIEKTSAGAVAEIVVKNTGKFSGDEVVQAYVSAPKSAKDRRIRHLAGFARVSLAPGEAKSVRIELPKSRFEVFGDDGRAFVPTGESSVFVGGGQPGSAEGQTAVAVW